MLTLPLSGWTDLKPFEWLKEDADYFILNMYCILICCQITVTEMENEKKETAIPIPYSLST